MCHSHVASDTRQLELLVDFLLSALEIEYDAIRCTSVPGHQLPFGETISSRLKNDIHSSSAIFALLTPQSLCSNWVLFELGASWALGKVVVPILGLGLQTTDLPGPSAEYPCIRIAVPDCGARLRDSVRKVARQLDISERTGGKAQAKLNAFIGAFRALLVSGNPSVRQATAFLLSWLLVTLLSRDARHPAAVREQVVDSVNLIHDHFKAVLVG
jgi:hypothetical protein